MWSDYVDWKLRQGLLALGVFVLFVGAAPGQAASARSPELEKVIDGAKRDAMIKLQWLGGRLDGEAGLRPMIAAMNKMYGMNIKLQFTPGPDFPTMLNKVIQEKSAGVPASSDIALLVSNNVAQGVKAGALKRMNWAAILERPAPAGANVNRIAPGGSAVMVASRIAGITYNSNQVRGTEIPASMEDVFNPKWRDKIAATTFATGFYHFATKDVLGYELMKNYVQRLAKQIGGLITCDAVDRVSSGEFAMLVFDCGQDDALRYQKRGAPVGFTTIKEATRVNLMYMGIPVNAEHPNAAALFINFLNTREGQKLQWEHARHDLHIYPESETRKLVDKVIAAKGKLALDTVERDEELGHEEISRIRDEFIKILKESGR